MRIGYCIVFTILVNIGFTQYLLLVLLERERVREREIGRERERQTDRDRQTDRQADRQTDRQHSF